MITPVLLAGRYRLDSLLGQGGMGQVHAGFDTLLQRKVAVKTLRETNELDAQARARFRREALAAAALDHPFICKVYEVGEHDGRSFIVMEFIEGGTLDALIADGSLTPRQLLDTAHEIAQALDEAHRHGIVHRDLKPSNIMRDVHGHVKVLDFGLAKQTGNGDSDSGATKAVAPGDTRPGTRLGTPSYMSPEQILGGPLDARSDVFSLGVVLHQLASGRHPFLKGAPSDTMAAILRDSPESTEGDLDVVPGFGRLVHRMLAKACAERFQTMHDVRGALEALRDSTGATTSRAGSLAAQALPPERTPFVARDPELAELRGHLDRMLLGQGGMVLLGGEPGVGKTRLARELQRVARERGCVAVTGQCYEQEGAPPYGPFVETMEQAIRTVPQALRAALGDVAAEMTMLAPDLRRVFPDVPPLPDIPPEQKRRVLFNAYLTYVRRATVKSAAVVLFDDLHWADDSSVQLLLHLAPHLSSMRLLVIGTYRDVDLDAKRPFAKALETVLRQRLATRINVKRLNASGVEQLLATMSGARPPEAFVRAVFDETEGNPFFVEEVFQHLKEEGRLFDGEGRWKSDLRGQDIDVPEGVRLVVSRRIERLGDRARKVLSAGAVIGRSFPLDLLESVADASDDAVLDCVEEAERAQLLQAERGREARYSFVHELIRSTLLGDLSLPRRQRLHVRVADALQARHGASSDGYVSMLAHHLYLAGAAVEPQRAIRAITEAMVRARAAGAFEDSLALAEQLMSFELPFDSDALALVEETQVDGLMALGRNAEALAASEQYLAHSLQRHDDARIPGAAMRMARIAAWLGASDAIAKIKQALASIPPWDHGALALAKTGYAGVLLVVSDMPEAATVIADALAAAEQAGNTMLVGAAMTMASVIEYNKGRPADSLRLAEQALENLADSHNVSIGTAVIQKAGMLVLCGHLQEFEQFASEGEALARRVGFAFGVWGIEWFRATLSLMRTGDLAECRAKCQQLAARNLPLVLGGFISTGLAMADLYEGRIDAAGDRLRDLVSGTPALTRHWAQANHLAAQAWSNRADEARRIWRDLAQVATAASPDVVGHRGVNPAIVSPLALALIGERGACAALYPALEVLPSLGWVSPYGMIGPTSPQLALAVSAEAAGMFERARGHFEEAWRLADTLPDRLLQPTVKMWFGRYLAARPDEVARGLALLENAATDFEKLGMPLHRERALCWQAEASRG